MNLAWQAMSDRAKPTIVAVGTTSAELDGMLPAITREIMMLVFLNSNDKDP